MLEKQCSVCGEAKAETEFHRRGSGLRSDCKSCVRSRNKAWAAANSEQVAATGKAWRAATVGRKAAWDKAYRAANSERILIEKKAYYAANSKHCSDVGRARYDANRAHIIARNKAWATANPEKVLAYKQLWRERHPDKVRSIGANSAQVRRSRIAKLSVIDFTAAQWIAKQDYFNGRCAYCLTLGALTMEHLVPISKGGSHTDENVVPACLSCNSAKRDRTLLEWVAR